MRTDIGKFTADTVEEMASRMGWQNVQKCKWDGAIKIDGIQLTSENGDKSTVQPWMEIIFCESVRIEPRGSLVSTAHFTFTNGDTRATFQPAWLRS